MIGGKGLNGHYSHSDRRGATLSIHPFVRDGRESDRSYSSGHEGETTPRCEAHLLRLIIHNIFNYI